MIQYRVVKKFDGNYMIQVKNEPISGDRWEDTGSDYFFKFNAIREVKRRVAWHGYWDAYRKHKDEVVFGPYPP